jgi:hypothetical protein
MNTSSSDKSLDFTHSDTHSLTQILRNQWIKFHIFFQKQPLWIQIFGTIMSLIIVIDGAILFFTLIGAFGYLSSSNEAALLEWSIQIINGCFTILCLLELPFRFQNLYIWIKSIITTTTPTTTQSNDVSGTGGCSDGMSDVVTVADNDDYPWLNVYKKPKKRNDEREKHIYMTKWKLFGIINIVKIFQIFCQCCVEYLCLAYIGRQGQRPSLWFAISVGFALPLGCIIGAVEGYLKS